MLFRSPGKIDTPIRGKLKVDLDGKGEQGDPLGWDPGPAKIDGRPSETPDKSLARCAEKGTQTPCAVVSRHSSI